ncbi:MAG: endonuclease/exonuclease/phosphatase family protein [Gemmatimonadota bacterium]
MVITACKEYLPFASNTPGGNWLSEQRVSAPSADITVMSQNLYVGADVDLVIRALASPDPSDDLPALLLAIETLGQTAYPARAEAIADAIARARPHAVGLQEVSEINIDLRPLGVPVFVSQDFLALLQDALTRRGLHYTVAGTSDNINVSLHGGLVRLFDHDVLLVDADRVAVHAASGQAFAVNLGPIAPGVSLIRGWVWAQTTVDGKAYTFATAHTESNLAGAPPGLVASIRAAQVGEMVATLASSERVILVGDLNDQPGSPMHDVLTTSGYTDSWAALRPGANGGGVTCCHLADLSDPVAAFDQRIDYVFTRGFAQGDGKLFGQIDRFGGVPADRLAGPAYRIWPSDHAGLIAAMR